MGRAQRIEARPHRRARLGSFTRTATGRVSTSKHPDDVLAERMLDAFRAATGSDGTAPSFRRVHRWRYALPTTTVDETFLFDPGQRIGVCGDWCGGPRVEGAFVSGLELAASMNAALGGRP